MSTNELQKADQHSLPTRALAGLHHNCVVCPLASSMPGSAFDKAMTWHRTWCPAAAAHPLVYGDEPQRMLVKKPA